MHKMLIAWKARTLSIVGRLTLIKSILSALPIHTMQSKFILRVLCDKIDQISRNVLWGDTSDHKRVH